ncbi:MAG: glycosyltransferase [Syntrophobacteraceae bacterium]
MYSEDENKSPLLIVQVDLAQDESLGDFYYRTYAPGVGMAQCDGVYVVNLVYLHRLKLELIREADVLILNNICDADVLPIIRDRKSRGKLTVYELSDDLEGIPRSNRVRAFYSQPKNMLLIKRLAHYCDALQFSSPELLRKYGYLNENCIVFHNHFLSIPPERPRKLKDEVIVGWGGSIGHLQDVANISERLIGWITSMRDVRLFLMCSESIWDLFKELPEDRKKYFAPGPLEKYYDFLSHLDIGIAPLEDLPFNRSRSDIKFLEYAAHGVAPVVQATGPYLHSVRNGKTGILFSTADELISALDFLAANTSERRAITANAREYLVTERNQLTRGHDRIDWYRSLMAAKKCSRDLNGSRGLDMFNRMSNCLGAKRRGRHLHLSSTRYELLLQQGLLASTPSETRSIFSEAIEMEPSLYMPYLFCASVSDDPVKVLEKAAELNPESIVSRLHLGKAFSSKNMIREAVESFNTALSIFPDYELPYIECAGVLYEFGLKEDAVELMHKAIEKIPQVIRDKRVC